MPVGAWARKAKHRHRLVLGIWTARGANLCPDLGPGAVLAPELEPDTAVRGALVQEKTPRPHQIGDAQSRHRLSDLVAQQLLPGDGSDLDVLRTRWLLRAEVRSQNMQTRNERSKARPES